MRRGISLLTLTISLLLPKPALGQNVDLTKNDSAQLVAMLGAPSFRARERAHRELIRRGSGAQSDIKRGTEHDDLEIRGRCRAILELIVVAEVDQRLAAFLAGKDDARMPMPGWAIVRDVAGDDETGRRIYAILYNG